MTMNTKRQPLDLAPMCATPDCTKNQPRDSDQFEHFQEFQNITGFVNSNLTEMIFKGRNFENAVIRNCNLTGVTFDGCNLLNCAFLECEITNINFTSTTFPQDAIFCECYLRINGFKYFIVCIE